MNVQIVGTMLDPSGGEPAGGAMIQFIALAQYGGVPKGAQSTQTTSATGEYDFPLNYGRYTLAINHSGRFVNQAVSVTVNEDSPSVMDIDLLLESSVPLTPSEIKYVEELVEQAEQAALSASNSASQAGVEVINATNQANIATNEADRAKSEADRATEVTGLDTVEQAVDMALGEFAGIMTESEARAINRINEAKYDASGMVHMGRHQTDGNVVNEGLVVTPLNNNYANSIYLGAPGYTSSLAGSSTSKYAVTNIAGAISNFLTGGSTTPYTSQSFNLPEAEDGTRIYDSTGDARGSGKASLDLKVDVDPKYGDVPTGTEDEILREAVGRAFEGAVKNGDFRLGDNGNWVGDRPITTDGWASNLGVETSTTQQMHLAPYSGKVTLEVTYECGAASGTRAIYLRDSGFGFVDSIEFNLGNFTESITVDVSDTTSLQLFAGTNSDVVVKSISFKPATEEVVTHPVDLVGLEYYEEELTGRQEVFECIQSLSTTFGTTSVPTVLSTRKLSYFQQYDGQFPEVTANPDFINDRYRCVVWTDLTDPQKREVAAYMGEKLFMGVNGFPVNGRTRARTIRGAGNGDWVNIESNTAISNWLQPTPNLLIKPQGKKDASPQASIAFPTYGTQLTAQTSEVDTHKGVFQAMSSTNIPDKSAAYQGRCFFYVVATVPRANKGAYVEGLNEYGCGQIANDFSGNGTTDQGSSWFSKPEDAPRALAECFHPVQYNTPFSPGVYVNSAGTRTGSIGQPSGHPDGIFYDGIEAGGLNGVIDWRLGAVANDSPEEAAKVEAKVENGTYRGLEKLVRTFVSATTAQTVTPVSTLIYFDDTSKFSVGDIVRIINPDNSVNSQVYSVVAVAASYIQVDVAYSRQGGVSHVVATTKTNLSVSGEFNTQMVVGDPVNILKTDALKNGWLGTCGGMPINPMPLSREALSTTGQRIRTTTFGASWASNSDGFVAVANTVYADTGSTEVAIYNYKAFAKQTKLSTNKPVLNATKGLLGVTVTQSHDKAVLAEAVAGIILKSDASGIVTEQSQAVKYLVDGTIKRLKTLPTDMAAPTNSSQAIKIAVYQISENGQVSLGFIANTMTHNGTDWGELDEIIIPFGDLEVDTFNDANGILQTAQSTMTAIPHGWTSNHARAGEQVPGVDL